MASKFRNTGQTCVCANRLLVQDRVYDEFSQKLAKAVGEMRIGDGLEGETEQGPLIDMAAVEKVQGGSEQHEKEPKRRPQNVRRETPPAARPAAVRLGRKNRQQRALQVRSYPNDLI